MKFVKMNLRIFVLAFIMILLLFVGSATAAKPEESVLGYEELVAQQAQAVQASQALKQYFFDNGWITEYPAYYGGSYIDGNTYYVRLCNPTEEELETLSSIFACYEDTVKYETCLISRTEALKYAGTVAIALYNQGFSVTECYVDSKTSDIIIGMQEDKIDEAYKWLEMQKFDTTSEYTPQIILNKGFAMDLG